MQTSSFRRRKRRCNLKRWKKIQIKGTSNFNTDLTSFGPRSEFDILEFLRLDIDEDKFYCYRIDIDDLKKIMVNEKESFHAKHSTGQRPRFSIIKKIIIPKDCKEYAIIDLNTGEVIKS
ncbi:Bsp6I family type II restriction endonuclease [Mycoplasma miroungigenitalium]|uniref:Bsp6I family type II restriction endonuclease n=1 Tax=Mycoplasma miroungigenitalium TaxID=754515 RepID=A0A6M4JA38_9MOLU|nr:Bsp6I family type II restriction endonuclease [Mycoplasma miroungigenitalium]